MSDAEHLRRFQTGDLASFTVLVRRWEHVAYRLAFRVTGDHQAAEDVRQAVFLRLFERPWSVRRAEAFPAWLRRSVVNRAIDVVRRRERLRSAESAALAGAPVEARDETEARLSAEEDRERLRRALAKLAPDERALLALRFDEDLSFREIARILDVAPTTVKSRAERAIERLRRTFDEKNP